MRSDNVRVVKRFQRASTHRAALTSQQRPRRDGQRFDLRDRTAAANQLLLCAIVAVLFVVGLVGGFIHRPELFALGALLIGLGGIAALAVPWTSIPAGWVAVLPLVDIVAIALMRQADPLGGLGLLWVFPAMWLATLGRAGLITSCVLIPALYWSLIALGPEPVFSFASFLLPLVIIAISSAVYASARRFAAQRDLLDAQAARLAFARSAAVQQEQLVTEVLDTVDFGVVRFSVGGDVVYENDAVGRLGGSMPRLHAAGETRVLLQEDGETPLDAHDHPLARACRGESFEDETVWSQDAEGRRVALTFTARRLLDHRGADAGGVLVARDVTAEQEALRARRPRRVGLARAAHPAHLGAGVPRARHRRGRSLRARPAIPRHGSRQRRTPARDHLRHPAHLAAVAHLGGGRRAPSRDRRGRARARVGARARPCLLYTSPSPRD